MSNLLLNLAFQLLDRGWLPDRLIRLGIRRLCALRLRALETGEYSADPKTFVESMRRGPIAPATDKANEQHYEVPAEFFEHCLGPHRKYSCCYYRHDTRCLSQAEAAALAITCEHADLHDGQDVLELGCGWGSLTLWLAQHYPASRITAVSNSHSQRRFIESQLTERGLHNIQVITCDMNTFDTAMKFDRVVSVEMFEHMRNYQSLLQRIAGWLRDDGKLFVHIFCHREHTYPFETDGAANWMGRHFFTGGLMPGQEVFSNFSEDLFVTRQLRWSGRHYARTANAWLDNLDRNQKQVLPILAATYGQKHAKRWYHRWRVFFMACAELWGYEGGDEWFVSHYLLEPVRRAQAVRKEAPQCEPQLV